MSGNATGLYWRYLKRVFHVALGGVNFGLPAMRDLPCPGLVHTWVLPDLHRLFRGAICVFPAATMTVAAKRSLPNSSTMKG